MTAARVLTRRDVVRVLVGVVALLAVLPVTDPLDGAQPDNLVLGLVTAGLTVRAVRLLRGRPAATAVPWWPLCVAGALFSTAGLLTGTGLSAALGFAGLGDWLLAGAVLAVPVACGLLAQQARRTRWAALLVDGLTVTVALLVVTAVLVLTAPDLAGPAGPLTVAYACCGALVVGLATALCTVAAQELRAASTALLAAALLLAAAVTLLAVSIDRSALVWQAAGDLATLLCLETAVLAVALSPARPSPVADLAARAPVVSRLGVGITAAALLAVPVVVLLALWRGQPITEATVAGIAVLLLLVVVRAAMRARDSGRLTMDLVRTEADFRDLVEGSSDGVAIVDGDLRLRFASPVARTLLGLPAGAAHPGTLLDLVDAEDRDRVAAELAAATGGTVHFRVTGPDGPADLEVGHRPRGTGDRRLLQLRDVTVRRRRERELERMAYTDHLTRLPNRAMLFQEMAAGGAERCLLVLDLDGFKAVNDVAGHEAGDNLLVEVAGRLRTVVRDGDVVCRLGGDEFAVVVEGTLAEAVEAAQRVVDVMALPHRTGGHTFAIGASVGVTELHPGGGQVAFREADTSLRAAKQAGKGCVRVWDDGTGGGAGGASVLAALAGGELEVRYNVAGRAGEPQRALHGIPFWNHPSGDRLPASELWAAAGRQGCSAALQTWLLAEATRQVAGLPGVSLLALDLPAGHVHAATLVGDVADALASSGLPAGRLSLALTEECLLTASADLAPALHELRHLGVRLCLDDFGMGQTLFAHLARVPLTSVRVDVSALGGDEEHRLRVVQAVVSSADVFGLVTVVHGVSPGPLLDAVLASGVHMVRTRDDLRHVDLRRVQEELGVRAPDEGQDARILTR